MIKKKYLDLRITDLEGTVQILEQKIKNLEAKLKPAKKATKKNAK